MASSPVRIMVILVPYFLIAYLYVYVMLVQRASLTHEIVDSLQEQQQQQQQQLQQQQGFLGGGLEQEQNKGRFLSNHNSHYNKDKRLFNSKLSYSSSLSNELKKRVETLEHKLDSYLAFGTDPFLSTKVTARCKNLTVLEEYCVSLHGEENAASKCHLGMPICLDDFPYNNCIVYDFGIREQPDFGVILSRPPFNCQVYAFDPSPITQKWYASDEAKPLREQSNYQLYHFGGGYEDGSIDLKEYNWDQVSIYQYPNRVLDPTNCTTTGRCRYHIHPIQKIHHLPVRSVSSIMKEFKHDRVDILKLDVEGSEYRMLESIIEQPKICQHIDQITLEWHHYDFDLRYGASSLPQLNVFHTLLKEECDLQQFWLHDPTGWPSNEKIYADMQLTLRYNIAAFMRCKPTNTNLPSRC